ncbi:MAG: nucleotide exchange factor GrpE [Candidatus Eremiobacteraeota bacterium]|nr:nucleotide exchange factor GrpE [Candidatus Eremiobacteraeota bacterium]
METEAQDAARSDDSQTETVSADEREAVTAELAAAKALADERYADLQYARAEIENVRKRAVRIADDRLGHARRQLLAKFLPVLDNLQRSLAYEDGEGLRGGLNATIKGFEGLLVGESITVVETVGKPFDPRIAEAIATRETSDFDDDVVVEEVQRGYRLGDELLRPAMVIVAKRIDAVDA